jgi:hypothetical protein
MPSRAFAVSICFGAVSLWALLPPTVPAGAGLTSDLSQFPKLQGKVKHVVGQVGSFVPPEAGESLQLELKDVTKLTSLTFDPAKKSYIPLPGPVVVESMHYYSNGAFQSMRLVSKKGHNSVTIDVSPRPGLGPKRVFVWVIVQSEVVEGVALIDCEYVGAFPDRAEVAH